MAVGYLNVSKYQYEVKERLAAVDSLDAGCKILEGLIEADPTNMEWKRDLSAAYGLIGNHWTKEGKFQKALESFSQKLHISQSLVRLDEKNVVWQQDVAQGHNAVGSAQSELGRESDALKSLLKAQAIFRKLSVLDAANAEYQVGLVISAWHISCLAPIQLSYQEASTLLRNAQLILARLAAKRALTHLERGWNQSIAERLSSWQRMLQKKIAHNL